MLRVCRFGRILANVTIWVVFSGSKWSLKILHAEFRQGTHGINCASIILNEFTHQTNRRTILGPDADKSRSKSAPPPPGGACGLGDSPSRNYNWAPRESWVGVKMGWACFISYITRRKSIRIIVMPHNTLYPSTRTTFGMEKFPRPSKKVFVDFSSITRILPRAEDAISDRPNEQVKKNMRGATCPRGCFLVKSQFKESDNYDSNTNPEEVQVFV